MKDFRKKWMVLITVFSLLAGVLAMPTNTDAKNTYWLVGISKAAGGNMKMYYKGNSIAIKGKVKKSASKKKVYDEPEKKCSYTLKVANNCKVTFIEAENVNTVSYKKWVKDCGYKSGDIMSCIEATFKVEDNKIVKISFSA